MRQAEVLFTHFDIVILNMSPEPGIVLPEILLGCRKRHNRRTEIVRGASHHAVRILSPVTHHSRAMPEVRLGSWLQERRADPISSIRGDIGHVIYFLRVMLHVIEVREGTQHTFERRVFGDIADHLTTDVHLTRALFQALNKLLTISRAHVPCSLI